MSNPFSTNHEATRHPHPAGNGVQYKFKFVNGYGASVVQFTIAGFSGSYGSLEGLWELAVLGPDGRLTYETPITDDVEGWLSERDVEALLDRIAGLPAPVAAQYAEREMLTSCREALTVLRLDRLLRRDDVTTDLRPVAVNILHRSIAKQAEYEGINTDGWEWR